MARTYPLITRHASPEDRTTVLCVGGRHQTRTNPGAKCHGWVAPLVYPSGIECGCDCHVGNRPSLAAAIRHASASV